MPNTEFQWVRFPADKLPGKVKGSPDKKSACFHTEHKTLRKPVLSGCRRTGYQNAAPFMIGRFKKADPAWQRVNRLFFAFWIALVSSGRMSAAVGRVMGQRPLRVLKMRGKIMIYSAKADRLEAGGFNPIYGR